MRFAGVNRLSQVCEAHVAGFDMGVLDSAFLLHCGLKTPFNAQGRKGQSPFSLTQARQRL